MYVASHRSSISVYIADGSRLMQVLAKMKNILQQFSHLNWTSELRNFTKFDKFIGGSVTDFMYHDAKGTLTNLLFGSDRRKEWKGAWPTFYLEVKTTNASIDNAGNVACTLSPLQYNTVSPSRCVRVVVRAVVRPLQLTAYLPRLPRWH